MKPLKLKKIVVNTPLEHCESVRAAMGEHGAARIGSYSYCTFSYEGIGRCLPDATAKPYNENSSATGVKEQKIETFCREEELQNVVKAIKKVHPYEEPVVSVFDFEAY
ncbi:MAG: hypothetical protein H6618_05365 [Deltaproteobacteria bacterium]|nr:hypothetical protein [Deltaproteobacteria bacterium]